MRNMQLRNNALISIQLKSISKELGNWGGEFPN
mgnify:CR=1 FL=1|jgi:hypothetical protein